MTKGMLAAVALLIFSTVKALAQPQASELLLRCGGKIIFDTNEQKQKSVTDLGIVINLTKKTVTGFVGVIANIYKTDDATISFEGEGPLLSSDGAPIGTNFIAGNIDRITGRVLAETTFTSDKVLSNSSWDLSCTPTTRLLPYQLWNDGAMVDCTKKFVDLSPRDAWQCMWQSKQWEEFSRTITDTLERLSNRTIGEWINIVTASAPTIEIIVKTIILITFIVLPKLASYVLLFIFIKVLFQRFSGRYTLTLKGSEKRQCMFWGIYLLATGGGMALIGRTDLFALLQGGWECFIGVAILALGPNWWGTYRRLDSAVAIGQIAKRTRKAAVIALTRHLDQLDISKNMSDNS